MTENTKRKILIVDDVKQNRIILSGILKDKYTVVEAADGDECLEKLRTDSEIVLVLLDLVMPRVSGFDVLKEMSFDEELMHKAVIVTTGDTAEDLEVKALRGGAIDYLEKPYQPKVVRSRVDNVVNRVIIEGEILENKLSRANEQLFAIMNLMPDGMAVFNYNELDGTLSVEHCNKYVMEMVDVDDDIENASGTVCKSFDDFLGYTYPDDLEAVKEKMFECMRSSQPVNCRFRIVAGSGLKWVRMSMLAFRKKHICRFHLLLSDITPEVEKEQQIAKALTDLEYAARHDNLTKLYKRSTFCSETEKFLERHNDTKFIIAIFDIKNFKVVNELFGNKAGDDILRLIASKIKDIVEPNGVYGRWESDRFVICVPKDMYDAHDIIDELSGMLSEVGIIDYNLKIFAGVYDVGMEGDVPVAQMCDRANIASKNAKQDYVGRVSHYDAKMRQAIMEEEAILSEMENALKNGQFKVVYQPIFSIASRKPVSAEALVRWIHPVNGIVPPNKFISIFENNKFITLLDWYVLEEVCKFQRRRMDSGLSMIPISVNFSRLDCFKPMICENVLGLVKSYGLSPEYIKIEITETAYTVDKEQIISVTNKFRNYGFKVLMDDFGSGYSSLNILKDVNLDVLKIDKKFIDDIEFSDKGCAIVSNVVNMTKMIGMDVIAEGVENQYQIDFLEKIGCDTIQGYYFSKPLFENDFNEVVNF